MMIAAPWVCDRLTVGLRRALVPVILAAVMTCPGGTGGALADPAPVSSTTTNSPVYRILEQLGFPDVRGGELINVRTPGYGDQLPWSSERARVKLPNAWRMPGDTNLGVRIIDLFGRSMLVVSPASSSTRRRTKIDGIPQVAGTWTGVDPTNLPALIQPVRDALGGKDERSGDDSDLAEQLAGLVFLAAGLERNGFNREADHVMETLRMANGFKTHPVVFAVNILANQQKLETLEALSRRADWAVCADRLDQLARQYGSQWVDGAVARQMAMQCRDRLKTDLSMVAGTNVLSVEDRAIVKDLIETAWYREVEWLELSNCPWVLYAPPAPGSESTKALIRLLDRGMASVPLLLALADSEVPLPWSTMLVSRRYGGDPESRQRLWSRLKRQGDSDASRFFGGGILAGGDDDTSGETLFTLQHLSLLLLAGILPGEPSEFPRVREELAMQAADWYATAVRLPRLGLALQYLGKGNYEQQSLAVRMILSEGTTNDVEHLKQFLLDTDMEPSRVLWIGQVLVPNLPDLERTGYITLLADHLEQRKQPLLSTSSSLFTKTENVRGSDNTRELERQLTEFRKLASTRKTGGPDMVRRLADAALKGPVPGELAQEAFRSWSEADPQVIVPAYLAMIRETPHAEVRVGLLPYLGWLRHLVNQSRNETGSPEDTLRMTPPWRITRTSTAVLEAEEMSAESEDEAEDAEPDNLMTLPRMKALWTELLDDQRPAHGTTVRMAAAHQIDLLYGERSEVSGLFRQLMPTRHEQAVLERARARMDGTDLPTLVDEPAIEAVKLEALELALGSLPEPAFSEQVRSLAPVELLALASRPLPGTNLVRRLADAAVKVRQADPQVPLESGIRLTTNDLVRVIAWMQGSSNPAVSGIVVTRQALLEGIRVGVTNVSGKACAALLNQQASWMLEYLPTNRAYVMARVHAYTQSDRWPASSLAVWMRDPVPADTGPAVETPDDAAMDDSTEDPTEQHRYMYQHMESQFWQTAGALCSATNKPLMPAGILILRMKPWVDSPEDEASEDGLDDLDTVDVDMSLEI
ncbi:MAG: hypothetical protein A2498_16780 [Lentisphaerae bacterium RIFOXYC12_FULL_60_16]|nr:MAG: hypothetical protein A2498_16780 [Lentisphaerae bacterium RIFOXYC12_FULL_60_16]OGV86772.1 MAG: hypothetical protein A2340_14035 [Lentisphaerae bacterium RIFOXYB12_FULL_60_10]